MTAKTSRTKAAAAWALDSRQRLHRTAGGLALAAGVVFAIGVGVITDSTSSAITPADQATHPTAPAPTYLPGDLATGDPRNRQAPPPPPATTGVPPAGSTPAAGVPASYVAAGFLQAWLAGAGPHTAEAHAAWAESLAPYVAADRLEAITATRLDELPTGSATNLSAVTVLATTTVTATLDTGRLVVIEMRVTDYAYRVVKVTVA